MDNLLYALQFPYPLSTVIRYNRITDENLEGLVTKRLTMISLILLGIALVAVGMAQTTHAQEGEDHADPAVLRGAALYAEFCGACHGPQGEAIAAGPAFHVITDYDPSFVKGRIVEGYDADPDDDFMMIGYGEDYNGPLSNEQIDDILAYMNTWSDEETSTPHLPEPNLEPGEAEVIGSGDPEHGAVVYAITCLGCHGRNAQGRDLDNFPAFTIDENARRIVSRGEGHGPVPALSIDMGGPLTDEDLDDLDAYLKSIEAEDAEQAEGVSILLIILGLGAVGAVGGAYFANQRRSNTKQKEENTA